MNQPDLNTEQGRGAYRAELRRAGRPLRLGGLALIVLAAAYVLAIRFDVLDLGEDTLVVAYGALTVGWCMIIAAIFVRNAHHKRRLAEGL